MSDVFNTGIRPHIDAYLKKKSEEKRDYGDYWSASSGGYCMRLNIMRRLGVPKVPELEDNATQTRIFEAGHIFHEWLQRITKDAGLSIASEVELQDEDLMVRGHFDDLILVTDSPLNLETVVANEGTPSERITTVPKQHLILYDYKTAHSGSFSFKKLQTEIGHYHKMQLGTYMYMLRKNSLIWNDKTWNKNAYDVKFDAGMLKELSEARILSISKDDLRMDEKQLLWSPQLEKDVYGYWSTLNGYWNNKKLPACTCAKFDGGFMARRSKKGKIYNDFMYRNPETGIEEPCSLEWYKLFKEKTNAST